MLALQMLKKNLTKYQKSIIFTARVLLNCFTLNVYFVFYLLNRSESLRKGIQEHRIIVLL